MTIRNALISSTIAISCLAAAAYADAAKAEGLNPYQPVPAASSETFDHGHGTYCSNRPLGALWSCEAPKLTGGGTGTGTPDPTSAEKQAAQQAAQHTPCPGPKS